MKNNIKLVNEWNDTHIPRGRVGHHETEIPKKYWIAIGDDLLINNYSEFVNQSLQLKPMAHNALPSFTTQDINKAKELAKRAVVKFPGKYVFFGVDDTSKGMMTLKNHLRASVRYYYDPHLKMWNDNDMYESEKEKVDEAYLPAHANKYMRVGEVKKALRQYDDNMKVILASSSADKYMITDIDVVPMDNGEDVVAIDIDTIDDI